MIRTHAQLVYELEQLAQVFDIGPADRVLRAAPFTHVNGLVRSMLTSMFTGAALHPVRDFHRRQVLDLITRERITYFGSVAQMFVILADTPLRGDVDLSSLRVVFSASAPLLPADNRRFRERYGLFVRQLYGSTETGTISVNLDADLETSLESVGTPLPGVRLRVVDDRGVDVAPGEEGEVVIASPAAVTEYPGNEEATAAAFRDGQYFSGDLGRLCAGRRAHTHRPQEILINRGGFKVNPLEVEAAIQEHPKVREVAVVGAPGPHGDDLVRCVIVASEPCTPEEIVLHCRRLIADFKIPKPDRVPRDAAPHRHRQAAPSPGVEAAPPLFRKVRTVRIPWRVVIGVLVSVLALALILKDVSLPSLGQRLAQAHYVWMIPNVAAVLLGMWARAVRWRALLDRRLSTRRSFDIQNAGNLLNNVLPLRLGELGKAYLASRDRGIPIMQAVSAVLIERLLDVLTVFAMLLIVLPHAPSRGVIVHGAELFAAAAFLGVVGLFIAAALRERAVALARGLLGWVPARAREATVARGDDFLQGVQAASGGRLAFAIAWSVVMWIGFGASCWFTLLAFLPDSAWWVGGFARLRHRARPDHPLGTLGEQASTRRPPWPDSRCSARRATRRSPSRWRCTSRRSSSRRSPA